MIKEIILSQNKTFLEKLLFFFFSIYPISFLVGNFVINFFLAIFFLLLVTGLFFKNFRLYNQNKILIYILLFLFASLIINLIFSKNFDLTLPRVLKFILIIGSILSFKQLIISYNEKELNSLYKIWAIIFFIVILDLIFELIFKSNIIGLSSKIPGRLSSFTGKEMIIGHYFSAFCLIFMSYIHLNFKKITIGFFVALFFIVLSFLIGERSNFFKTLIILSAFIFFIYDIKLRYKVLSILVLFLFIVSFLNFSKEEGSFYQEYKLRYFTQVSKIFEKNGIRQYLDNSQYGAHYKVATEIFKENPIFGVGIKNFRVESFKKKYEYLDHSLKDQRGNTHPHQIHYEFLSETGLFGYLTFMSFILISLYFFFKSYKKNRNIYQFSGMLFVLVNLAPLLPSGSFFSTYSAGLFWINYSIMVGYIGKETKF